MKIHIAFLCNAARITKEREGIFDVKGGLINYLRIDILPAQRPITVVAEIQYDSVKESGRRIVKLRVTDSRGKDAMLPLSLKENFVPKVTSLGFIKKLKPKFCNYGWHYVKISVDGDNLITIPLNIMPFDE